eukprot:1147331-Pelagomonas_calceolata.AAC.4
MESSQPAPKRARIRNFGQTRVHPKPVLTTEGRCARDAVCTAALVMYIQVVSWTHPCKVEMEAHCGGGGGGGDAQVVA